MFRFANDEILFLLILIPILGFAFLWGNYLRKRKLMEFGDSALIESLMPEVSLSRQVWKYYLTLFVITVLIFVMARPQFGSKLQTVKRQGIELVIVLDVSNSMMAEDIKPNRLESAKMAVSKMVDRLHEDKIGLIVFAGDAYTQLPITSDYVSAKLFLSSINPTLVPIQGTAIGKAINLATRSFSSSSDAGKAIVVITDGENHEDDAISAARQATEMGIQVYAIGMGTPQGGPIPVTGTRDFRKDNNGNVVVSKLDMKMLEDIAMAGGGVAIRASNVNVGLNALFDKISEMDKGELETRVYSDYEEQFVWLAWIVFVLLFVELFILERKNKFLKNIRLFKKSHETSI